MHHFREPPGFMTTPIEDIVGMDIDLSHFLWSGQVSIPSLTAY